MKAELRKICELLDITYHSITVDRYENGVAICKLCEVSDDCAYELIIDHLEKQQAKQMFEDSIKVAREVSVPEENIVKSKEEIDNYFKGVK